MRILNPTFGGLPIADVLYLAPRCLTALDIVVFVDGRRIFQNISAVYLTIWFFVMGKCSHLMPNPTGVDAEIVTGLPHLRKRVKSVSAFIFENTHV